MLVISIQWASRFWLGWQVLAHPSWLEGYMLRRFASDCSCLFTASQIAPENSPNVAIPTSAISGNSSGCGDGFEPYSAFLLLCCPPIQGAFPNPAYRWQDKLDSCSHTLGATEQLYWTFGCLGCALSLAH